MGALFKINEIFYSLQGEGHFSGRPAVFVRFSGCNLKCPFCDTDFRNHTDYTIEQLLDNIEQYKNCRFVVLTGGEPTLQVSQELVDALRADGWEVSMETNGTHTPPAGVWVTVSPKTDFVKNGQIAVTMADEVKVVFDGEHKVDDYGIVASEYYLQPCDTGDEIRNHQILHDCIDYIMEHPKWRLSLQTQKILDVR